jgi:hypothetical protein
MLEIPLTQGKVALIDDEDLALVSAHKWRAMRARNTWYALTRVPDPSKRDGRRTVGMHRLIMDAPAGVEVDHENHNGLDNQRTNLRLAPDDGNRRNRRVNSNSTSGYKGVCWDKRDRKWRAQIQFDGKRHSGYFDDPTDAALAYDVAARELHGEFASPNFGLPAITLTTIVGDAIDMLAYDDLVAELEVVS